MILWKGASSNLDVLKLEQRLCWLVWNSGKSVAGIDRDRMQNISQVMWARWWANVMNRFVGSYQSKNLKYWNRQPKLEEMIQNRSGNKRVLRQLRRLRKLFLSVLWISSSFILKANGSPSISIIELRYICHCYILKRTEEFEKVRLVGSDLYKKNVTMRSSVPTCYCYILDYRGRTCKRLKKKSGNKNIYWSFLT